MFLRRVNSRILYEQMLGRATRRCDEIDKETFRIFDAVDIYANLQHLTTMKPVVVDPSISLEQLWGEFATVDDAHRETVRDQILVKMRRRLKHLHDQARARYETEAGETPEMTLQRFAAESAAASADWVRARQTLGRILDWDPDGTVWRAEKSRGVRPLAVAPWALSLLAGSRDTTCGTCLPTLH